ncbi:TetR/AcrR family transcriptional regulator [Novosphingobium sp. B 225]|uniref:TetR/AcrR family transcriptional regulator n=1 Tax=Novosphingobium sp. B 225 TaxID=1961849 RepID=UPI0020CBE417|nr:TetR/AcrR family transcriptional regulator [Novosphingobium sp. B 225]
MKQQERRLRTRDAILREAELLFGSEGFDATTVDMIALRAGVAKGAVYHHFAGKREIFEAVFENAAADLAGSLAGQAAHPAPIIDALVASTRAFFVACSNPAVMQIILKDAPTVLGYERWKQLDGKYFAGMVTAGLAAAMEQGAIAPQPLEPLSHLMLAAMQSAAIDCASSEDFSTAAEAYLTSLEALLRGLAKR